MKKIKNTTSEAQIWVGQTVEPGAYYSIQAHELSAWAEDNAVVSALANGSAVMNDGDSDIVGASDGINFLKNKTLQTVNINTLPPFASKTFGAKKLFKRVVGIRQSVDAGENVFAWSCPFPWVKFMAVELFGAETGDYLSFRVLDSTSGLLSGIPNFQLNQFGFEANVAKDFYVHKSEFDADLYQGLQIEITYVSSSPKQIGVNFVMNELKD